MTVIDFIKMESCRNEFVILERPYPPVEDISSIVQTICDRQLGIGSDGLVWLQLDATSAQTIPRIHLFNADGSRPKLCVNAFRCIALLEQQRENRNRDTLMMSDNGIIRASRKRNHEISIHVLEPQTKKVQLPPWAPVGNGYYVWTGDPHIVLLLDLFFPEKTAQFEAQARQLRWWQGISRAGSNVHYITRESSSWRIRSFERGVERETAACGSGCLAAANILHRTMSISLPIRFRTTGGDLITTDMEGKAWTITGPAKELFRGTTVI